MSDKISKFIIDKISIFQMFSLFISFIIKNKTDPQIEYLFEKSTHNDVNEA